MSLIVMGKSSSPINGMQIGAALIELFFDCDMAFNVPDPEYEQTFTRLKQQVILRVLEPQQADGRVLEPCLVDGGLWQENIGTNEATNEPMIYDPSVFYAHNEYELRMWRTITVRVFHLALPSPSLHFFARPRGSSMSFIRWPIFCSIRLLSKSRFLTGNV